MCIASTAATVTHSPRVHICVSPAQQPLSPTIHVYPCVSPALQSLPPTGHVYPYVYRQHCSHCHPMSTCIHMCITSTAATVTPWPRVSICVSPALQPLSHTCHVYPYVYRPHCSHCHPLATCIHMRIASTAATVTPWPRESICVSPALQPLSHTCHVYPYVYRLHCSHCHPLATCIHMRIASTADCVTHCPHASICVSPALQPLSPTGHVYP